MDKPTGFSNSINKIRTYAMDLDVVRNKRNDSTNNVDVNPPKSPVVSPIEKEVFKAPVSKVFSPKKVVTVIKRKEAENSLEKTPALKPIPTSLTEKASTTTNKKSIIVDTEDGAAATIITDTKKNRFRLIPAIITSIKRWFEKEKKALAVKKTPKYSVPDSSLRKGVIQKATSKTGRFATADFDSIQERIKKRNQIIEEQSNITTTWSPHTETGFFLLEAPTPTPVTNVQVESRKSFTSPTTPITVPKEITDEPVVEALPETTTVDDNRWNTDEVSQPIVTTDTEPTYSVTSNEISDEINELTESIEETSGNQSETYIESEPVAEAESVEVETQIENVNLEDNARFNVPIKVLSDEEEKVSWFRRREFWLSTNIMTLAVATVMIFIIATGTIMLLSNNQGNDTTPSSLSPILNKKNISSLEISSLDIESLTEAFTTIEATVDETVELVPTIDGVEITSKNIFSLLYPTADISFIHAVKKIHLGYSEQQVPFIIFNYSDEQAIFGGMLVWEHTMMRDLSGILGNSSDGDLDFTDDNISNHDVRHISAEGQDVLVYGIIDNSVIITTDKLTLESIIPLIK